MNWTYPQQMMQEQSPAGVAELLGALEAESGGAPLEGTRFLFDAREMLEMSREIERRVSAGSSLYAGFQDLKRFLGEAPAYDDIARRGVAVMVFGARHPEDRGLQVSAPSIVSVAPSRTNLENQWFLVATGNEQLAFVGYELSKAAPRTARGLRDKDRIFAGFASEDPRVVGSLARHLAGVISRQAGSVRIEPAVTDTLRDAQLILVMTDDGRDPALEATRAAGEELSRQLGATLLLYDISAESYFTDPYPYPDVIGPERTLGAGDASSLGRGYLAEQIEVATERNVSARAWLPMRHGARGLTECVDRFSVSGVVIPSSFERPSFGQRLRGHRLEQYRAAVDVPIVLATPDRRAILDVGGSPMQRAG